MLKNSLFVFSLSYALIQPIKAIQSFYSISFPVYGIMLFISVLLLLKQNMRKIDKTFFLFNGLLILFAIIRIVIGSVEVTMPFLKYSLGHFLMPNLYYLLFISIENEREFSQNIFNLIMINSWFMIICMTISFIIHTPLSFYSTAFNDYIFSFETFLRKNNKIRDKVLDGINFAEVFSGLIFGKKHIVSLAGPQLVLYPFFAIVMYISGLVDRTSIKIKTSLFVFGFFIYLQNSRAMILTVLCLLIWKGLSRLKHFKLLRYTQLLAIIFPFLLFLLSGKFLNGRDDQMRLLKEKFSFFGNGLGQSAVDVAKVAKYYTFDNIHFEVIYNFGLFGYSILLVLILKKLCNLRFSFYSGALLIFVFIFQALNFNFYDPYFFLFWVIFTKYHHESIKMEQAI